MAFLVRIVEFKNEIVLKNIVAVNYGRVGGRKGSNLKRLSEKYGTTVNSKNTKDGNYDFSFSGSTTESRLEAIDDIMEGLLVMIECDDFKIQIFKRSKIKQMAFSNFVRINMPKLSEEKILLINS